MPREDANALVPAIKRRRERPELAVTERGNELGLRALSLGRGGAAAAACDDD